MTPGVFCWYELRTKDTSAAAAFYADLLGWHLQSEGPRYSIARHAGEKPFAGISVLPERAAALGAPAHWLGHIGVSDVGAAVRGFVEAGSQQLGPSQRSADGEEVAVFRDPFGTIVALSSKRGPPERSGVVWHQLNTRERERAWPLYAGSFGWRQTDMQDLDLGPEVGPCQVFAWEEGGPSAGGMANTARLPHIHTHWLFSFDVEDLDACLARFRALGGKVVNGPKRLPSGDRVAQCDDLQGAAFGLYESRTRAT
jgi:uncharacterized protein